MTEKRTMTLTVVQKFQLLLVLLEVFLECNLVNGHAKMTEPPMRSSMWRFGFDTPVNYDDNELFCGGIQRFMKNDGQCGTCGDPYDDPHPEHEAGGKFATGTIVRYFPRYTKSIPITIDVTAHHKGFFEFRLCAHNNVHTRVSQQCLDQNLLVIEEGEHRGHPYRFFPKDNGLWNVTVRIPPDITCTQCVLQMRYKAGNSWGLDPKDPDRGPCIGCGVQEEFRNCADISIGYPEPPSTTVAYVTETGSKADNGNKQTSKSKHKLHHQGHSQRHIHTHANTGERNPKDKEINKKDQPYSQIHKDRNDKSVKNEKRDFSFRVRRIEETLSLLDDTERVLSGLARNFDENPMNKKMSGLQYVKVYSGLVWTKRKIRHLEKLINKIVSKLYLIVNTKNNIAESPEDQGVYMSEYAGKNSLVKSRVRIDNKATSTDSNGATNPSGQQLYTAKAVRKQTTSADRYTKTTSKYHKREEVLNHDSLINTKIKSAEPVEHNDARYTLVVRNIKSDFTEKPVTVNTRARERGNFITASDTNRAKGFMTSANKNDTKTLLVDKFPALGSWGNKHTQKGMNSKEAKSKSSVLAPNAMPWSPPVSPSSNTDSTSSYTRSGTTSKLFQTRYVTHPTMKPAVQSRSKFSAGVATPKSPHTRSQKYPKRNKKGLDAITSQRSGKTIAIVKPTSRTEGKGSSQTGKQFNSKIEERSKTTAKKYHTDKSTGFKVVDSNVIQKEIMPTLNALGLAASSPLGKQNSLIAQKVNALPPRLKKFALSKWMRAEIRNRILHQEYLQSALAEHSRNENSVIKAA